MKKFLLNKYVITFIISLGWVLFFDKNNLSSQLDLTRELRALEKDKKYYLTEIEKNTSGINELRTSPATLEKFAREKYLMKKDNEDVFVFVEKK